MRRVILALIFFSIPVAVIGQTKLVKVSELETLLTEAHDQHRSDTEITQQLNSLDLSERLTDASLTRLQSLLEPSSQAATALQLIADQSIFYEPSSAEIADTAIPDSAISQQIFKSAAEYVLQYLSASPNLLATRTTISYSGGGYYDKKGKWIDHPGLNQAKIASQEISTRNDHLELPKKDQKRKDNNERLNSRGEFGGILYAVINDSSHGGTVYWSYWERSSTGKSAVFAFQVPQPASHYSFSESDKVVFPPYHGLLWVDPLSGAVTDVFIQIEPFSLLTYQHFAILVHYRPVKIDDKTCICPTRSMAVEKGGALFSATKDGMWLNETTFTNYHRFGSSVQIITDTAPQSSEKSGAKN